MDIKTVFLLMVGTVFLILLNWAHEQKTINTATLKTVKTPKNRKEKFQVRFRNKSESKIWRDVYLNNFSKTNAIRSADRAVQAFRKRNGNLDDDDSYNPCPEGLH